MSWALKSIMWSPMPAFTAHSPSSSGVTGLPAFFSINSSRVPQRESLRRRNFLNCLDQRSQLSVLPPYFSGLSTSFLSSCFRGRIPSLSLSLSSVSFSFSFSALRVSNSFSSDVDFKTDSRSSCLMLLSSCRMICISSAYFLKFSSVASDDKTGSGGATAPAAAPSAPPRPGGSVLTAGPASGSATTGTTSGVVMICNYADTYK